MVTVRLQAQQLKKSTDREQGAALLLGVLLMTALVSFGLAYVEVSAAQLENQNLELEKIQARALAEAGLAHAHSELALDASWSGPLRQTLGDGGYEVTVQNVAGGLVISSVGSGETVGSGAKSVVAAVSSPNVRGAMIAGNQANFQTGSNVTWSGTLLYENQLSQTGGGSGTGSSQQIASGATAVGINFADAYAAASTLIEVAAGVYTNIDETTVELPGGDYAGVIYCDGNLVVTGDTVIEGTLVVAGNLIVQNAGSIKFRRGESAAVIMAGGVVQFNQISNLSIVGTVFAQNNIRFQQVSTFEGFGSLVSNQHVQFQDSMGHWEFDPGVNDQPISYVSGSPVATRYQVTAQTQFTADPIDCSAHSDSRGAITSSPDPDPDPAPAPGNSANAPGHNKNM